MNARSLVGMTQGARKRAAHRRVRIGRMVPGGRVEHAEELKLYAKARAAYRIGERLRPCPCLCHEGFPRHAGPCLDLAGRPTCDGSGVLPARVRSSHIRALRPGDQVRMPCAPDRWETVTEVQDTSIPGFDCFVIRCGDFGHGGESPLEIRRAKAR